MAKQRIEKIKNSPTIFDVVDEKTRVEKIIVDDNSDFALPLQEIVSVGI